MALIVEDGTGIANAESLCSVAFFRDYHAKRGTDVTALEDATVEQLLRKATDYFVATYGAALNGVPIYVDQPLPFPHSNATGVPLLIQQAIAELAFIAKATPLMPNITRGKKSVKVGPLAVEYDGNSAVSTNFVAASLRIAPFLGTVSGAMMPLTRC